MTSIFDKNPVPSQGCPECGAPNEVIVQVSIRKLVDSRPDGPHVSRSRNYCLTHGEAHAVAMAERIGKWFV